MINEQVHITKEKETKKLPLISDVVFKRSTHYMSKMLSDELKKSEEYIQVKKTIVINFLNFEFYQRNSYRSVAHMKFEKTKPQEFIDMGYTKEDEIATKDLEMHFIEIPKFVKKNPEANTKLEQWLWLIVGREEKLKMAKKENKEIKKAMDIIDEMSMDPKEWELYESRRLAIMDYNTGMHQSREEGKKEKQIEIAKNMLNEGMEIETISRLTNLTVEEIEEIEKIKQNKE